VARALFLFFVAEKGSGDLTIGFVCNEITRLCQGLITDDESKRGVKDLWDYVSQLDIHINSCNQYNSHMEVMSNGSTKLFMLLSSFAT